jgi:hypothetical protein
LRIIRRAGVGEPEQVVADRADRGAATSKVRTGRGWRLVDATSSPPRSSCAAGAAGLIVI